MNLLNILSFILAVIAYSIKELQSHNKLIWAGDHTNFWGQNSWMRKYNFKGDMYHDLAPDNWYYTIFKIKYKERFPLSATALVMFTDGYHLMQFCYKVLFIVSLVTYEPIFNMVWNFIIYFALWGITFTVTYKLLSK